MESINLYGLEPAEQAAVLDALLAAQTGFPVVPVDGVAACVDDISADGIAEQMARSVAR